MSYRKIAKKTITGWKRELEQWSVPSTFAKTVERIRWYPGFQEVIWKQAGLGFFRDAYVAAKVAERLSATRVRLCPDDRPDFELEMVEGIRKYEVTEADMPGRRRGDERTSTDWIDDPVEDWRKRFDAIAPAVTNVLQKKLRKQYSYETRLVVYVNLSCYGAYLKEGVPLLRDVTRPAKDVFCEVLTYWEGNLYRFWEGGKARFRSWKPSQVDDC